MSSMYQLKIWPFLSSRKVDQKSSPLPQRALEQIKIHANYGAPVSPQLDSDDYGDSTDIMDFVLQHSSEHTCGPMLTSNDRNRLKISPKINDVIRIAVIAEAPSKYNTAQEQLTKAEAAGCNDEDGEELDDGSDDADTAFKAAEQEAPFINGSDISKKSASKTRVFCQLGCGKSFSNITNRNKHQNLPGRCKRGIVGSPSVKPAPSTKKWVPGKSGSLPCSKGCGVMFADKSARRRHEKRAQCPVRSGPSRPFPCSIQGCTSKFTSDEQRLHHEKTCK